MTPEEVFGLLMIGLTFEVILCALFYTIGYLHGTGHNARKIDGKIKRLEKVRMRSESVIPPNFDLIQVISEEITGRINGQPQYSVIAWALVAGELDQ